MQHFRTLSPERRADLFSHEPEPFTQKLPYDELCLALGATLYTPANHPRLGAFLRNAPAAALILCLEDSLGDGQLAEAEDSVVREIDSLQRNTDSDELMRQLPLMFLRVRSAEHLLRCGEKLGERLRLFSGIVMPKFDTTNAKGFLNALNDAEAMRGNGRLYGMPVLETTRIIRKETRVQELSELRQMLETDPEQILNIRFGAVDFAGLYALRRPADTTVYDVELLRDCIGDLVNLFGAGAHSWVVSGGVYEHYCRRQARAEDKLRMYELLRREVQLDKVNGLWGRVSFIRITSRWSTPVSR